MFCMKQWLVWSCDLYEAVTCMKMWLVWICDLFEAVTESACEMLWMWSLWLGRRNSFLCVLLFFFTFLSLVCWHNHFLLFVAISIKLKIILSFSFCFKLFLFMLNISANCFSSFSVRINLIPCRYVKLDSFK